MTNFGVRYLPRFRKVCPFLQERPLYKTSSCEIWRIIADSITWSFSHCNNPRMRPRPPELLSWITCLNLEVYEQLSFIHPLRDSFTGLSVGFPAPGHRPHNNVSFISSFIGELEKHATLVRMKNSWLILPFNRLMTSFSPSMYWSLCPRLSHMPR